MAITTLVGVRDAVRWHSYYLKNAVAGEAAGRLSTSFYASSLPAAASAPSPGLGGAALTSYAGQLPWVNPTSGSSYLALLTVGMTSASYVEEGLLLYDRLWHNSGISVTTTTGQTIDSVAWPARDRNGSTDGDDVLVGIEVSSATGASGSVTNTTITYTNSAGTGSRTGTMASFPTTAQVGTFVPFELAAGDQGIRSIQTLTLGTSYVSGTIHLVAYRKIAQLCVTPQAVQSKKYDAGPLRLGFPKLYDNSVLYILRRASSTASHSHQGAIAIVQG